MSLRKKAIEGMNVYHDYEELRSVSEVAAELFEDGEIEGILNEIELDSKDLKEVEKKLKNLEKAEKKTETITG